MKRLSDSIIIEKPIWEVYKIAADVERHPKYIPYFKECQVLKRTGDNVIVKRTAEIEGKPYSWLGSITYIKENSVFEFEQIDGPLKGMTGEWIFEMVPEGTKLTITHNITFDKPVIGKFMEWYVAKRFVSKSSMNTLVSLKKSIEAERDLD